jgi:hypothetical protein
MFTLLLHSITEIIEFPRTSMLLDSLWPQDPEKSSYRIILPGQHLVLMDLTPFLIRDKNGWLFSLFHLRQHVSPIS